MNLQDIILSPGTRVMLEANGKSDCDRGVSMHDGWRDVATSCRFDPHRRTPAREAYEDGYYSGKFGSKK